MMLVRREGQVQPAQHDAFMAATKRFKVVSGSLTDLITKYAMHNIIEHVLDIEDADAYMQMNTSWGKHLAAVNNLITSLSKAVADVKSQVTTKKSESTRAKKRQKDDEEKAAIRKVREEATENAAAIKKQQMTESEQVLPIYSLELVDVPAAQVYNADTLAPDWTKPFVRKESEACDLWAGEAKVQKALTAFWGQYKRAQEAASGRSQYPFEDNTGLKETATLCNTANICPPCVLDLNAIVGGKSFQEGAWMFGYTPEMKYSGLAPNCGTMLRWVVLGSFHSLSINTLQLVQHMTKAAGVEDTNFVPTLQSIQSFIETLTLLASRLWLTEECRSFRPRWRRRTSSTSRWDGSALKSLRQATL